jgi:hypothetical protein
VRPHYFSLGALLLLQCGGTSESGSQSSGGEAGQGGASGTGTGGASGTGTGGAGAGRGGTAGTGQAGVGGGSQAGAGGCDCGFGLTCCDGVCVNPTNDIKNCGTCGTTCPGPDPFCSYQGCGQPPCEGATCGDGETCCGSACCSGGQLCCYLSGPGPGGFGCFEPNDRGTCPPGCPACICAAPDTPIATPFGERPIADLAPGDLVYSVDGEAIRAVPVRDVKRRPAEGHAVPRVVLANGRVLEISAGHPTADGRTFGQLRAGSELDGSAILEVHYVPYRDAFTYDILPASSTGTYFAAGALIGSTLTEAATSPLSCQAADASRP